jgi:hypothetical protein
MQTPSSKKYSIEDLLNLIKEEPVKSHPTLKDYLDGEAAEYFESISEALLIIQQYKKPDRTVNESLVGQDCIRLSALHSHISVMVGYLQGMSSQSESIRKLAKSKYVMSIKEQRHKAENNDIAVRLTETELDHASRVLSEDHYEKARDMEVISRMITTAYYAIGDFINILNSTCNRLSKERMYDKA